MTSRGSCNWVICRAEFLTYIWKHSASKIEGLINYAWIWVNICKMVTINCSFFVILLLCCSSFSLIELESVEKSCNLAYFLRNSEWLVVQKWKSRWANLFVKGSAGWCNEQSVFFTIIDKRGSLSQSVPEHSVIMKNRSYFVLLGLQRWPADAAALSSSQFIPHKDPGNTGLKTKCE